MNLLGITGNLMSLGAIDFGLLVDGSVVVIETILARTALSRVGKSGESKVQMIKASCKEVMGPVVAGLLLIMAVYLPILTLEGVEGKMFRPMAITVLMALGASLFVTVFIMPILADLFLKTDSEHGDHETWFFRKIKSLFIPIFDNVLKKPLPYFVAAGLFGLIAIFLFTKLGSDFVPELDEGDLVVGITRSARIGIDSSVLEQTKAEQVIKSFLEVNEVLIWPIHSSFWRRIVASGDLKLRMN